MSAKDLSEILILPEGESMETMGIPWIYENPRQHLLQWHHKIKSVADYYERQALRAENELRQVDLLKSTKTRLARLADSYKQSSGLFLAWANELQPKLPLLDNEKIFFEKIPRQQTVMAYHETVFRDWAWGKNEIRAQAELLLPYFKDTENLLVLGAGACGLPLALHSAIQCRQTAAVDINPALFFIVKKILSGEPVEIYEYPPIPKDLESACIKHRLEPMTDIKGFQLLFGDGQSLNFKPESFTTLLTPWFIDIVPRDFRSLARHLNQALQKDGRWIGIGQLSFHRNKLSEIYTKEEIQEALEESGFILEEMKHVALPYLQSPHSMIGRTDQILVFSARKAKNAKKPARYEYLPEWLRDWSQPIPSVDEIKNFQIKTNVFAQTINLIDGKRNLEDIAQILSGNFGLPIEAARESVYNFMINVYEQLIFREF